MDGLIHRSRVDIATRKPASAEPPRLCFVHIPKTAGTSVTSALERAYGASAFPGMTTLDYRCYSDADLAGFRLFKGHAYRRDYERLPEGTLRLTILRDPVRRAVSYYNYYRSIDVAHVTDAFVLEAVRQARTGSVLEFIYSDSPFIVEHLRLGQMRQFLSEETLAEISHRQFLTRALQKRVLDEALGELKSFQFILTCEALALSFPPMVAGLGLPESCRRLGRENVSARGSAVDLGDVRRAMIDVSGPEFSFYEHVRERELAWLARELVPRG